MVRYPVSKNLMTNRRNIYNSFITRPRNIRLRNLEDIILIICAMV